MEEPILISAAPLAADKFITALGAIETFMHSKFSIRYPSLPIDCFAHSIFGGNLISTSLKHHMSM